MQETRTDRTSKRKMPEKTGSADQKKKKKSSAKSSSRRRIPAGGSSEMRFDAPLQEDLDRFQAALDRIVGVDRMRPTIGTLSEKTVHAVVKNYLEPDEDHQEIPLGKYVADIYRDGQVIEIQTRQMGRLKEKLSCFLQEYDVTVVYPVLHRKILIWVDPDSGELSAPRRTGMVGSIYTAFRELYLIRDYLGMEHLQIRLILMDMTEYKLLTGRSKDRKKYGARRFDRIPTALVAEMVFRCPQDYMQLLPSELPEEFTSLDFAREAHIPRDLAANILQILRNLEIIEKIGTRDRSYLYRCRY